MNKLKKYAGLLNDEAPEDHFLAYITGNERDMLIKSGGKETSTPSGIFAYPYWDLDDTGGADYSSEPTGGTGSTGDNQVPSFETTQTSTPPPGHPEWHQIEAKKTVKPTDTLTTRYPTSGRPDVIYKAPTGKTIDNYNSNYELNQIKHIQDEKLKTVKGKLRVAGFTDLPDDANFQQTKDYITELNEKGKILDSWRDAKDKDGNLLYGRVDSNTGETTIEKWDRENYFPQSPSMRHWSTDLLGKVSPSGTAGAPLSFDQLMNDFDLMEKVGKSGGGAMDWKERMKTFSPKQYEVLTGTVYNPHTQTYTPRDLGEGSADERLSRVADPYIAGGTTAPQQSQAANYFANLNNTNLGINQNYLNTYNTAKSNMANTLNMTQNTQQYGYGNTFNNNYARSMTSANPFFEELTSEGLI